LPNISNEQKNEHKKIQPNRGRLHRYPARLIKAGVHKTRVCLLVLKHIRRQTLKQLVSSSRFSLIARLTHRALGAQSSIFSLIFKPSRKKIGFIKTMSAEEKNQKK
jgi:hypothetical protein